jgi:putative ABC transport system permease protein
MLSVASASLAFEATAVRPVLLVAAGGEATAPSRVARALVHLDYPAAIDLHEIALGTSGRRPLSPASAAIPVWRTAVAYVNLASPDPPAAADGRPQTPLDTVTEAARYASRRPRRRQVSAERLSVALEAALRSVGLHPTAKYAPYSDLTPCEASLVRVAVVLALGPRALVLDGTAPDDCAARAIETAAARAAVPLVWANCGDATRRRLVANGASVVTVDVAAKCAVASDTGPVAEPSRPTRKWPAQQHGRSTTSRPWGASAASVALLASPVLAKVGPRTVLEAVRQAGASTGSVMQDVHLWQLLVASAAILVVIAGQWRLGIGLEVPLFVSAVRCAVQLNLLGYLLVPVFENDSHWLVAGFLCAMLAVAAQEATARPPYAYDKMFLSTSASIAGVFFVVMSFGTYVLQSGFSAIVVIPIGGMLISNCLTSTAIALTNVLTFLAEQKSQIEVLLCLGATRLEATREALRRSVTLGLTPIVSLMNTAGIVSISGLMAGQLLAHAKPINAARNQIVLLFLITTCTAASCASATVLSILAIVDGRHRVRSERLQRRKPNNMEVLSLAWSAIQSASHAAYEWVMDVRSRNSASFRPAGHVQYNGL